MVDDETLLACKSVRDRLSKVRARQTRVAKALYAIKDEQGRNGNEIFRLTEEYERLQNRIVNDVLAAWEAGR